MTIFLDRLQHASERLRRSWYSALAAFVILACGTAYALHTTAQVAVRNCGEIEVVKKSVRETLEQGEKQFDSSPVRTRAEKESAKSYYALILSRFVPRHC